MQRTLTALSLATLALALTWSGTVRAGEQFIPCFGGGGTPGVTYAANGPVTTDDGHSGTEVDSQGLTFDDAADSEGWCEWLVPSDYNDASATEPTLTIMGWSTECVLCVPGLTCATTRTMDFEVSMRAFGAGETASADWGTAASVEYTWSSESCGSPCSTNCWQADKVRSSTLDITGDAADIDVGDLVFIRIKRKNTSDTPDLPSPYHVAHVKVTYP